MQPAGGAARAVFAAQERLVHDSGRVDVAAPQAQRVPVDDLPASTLVCPLDSRRCDAGRMSKTAWQRFGHGPTGWARVQAICNRVHRRLPFGHEHASRRRSASQAHFEGRGARRDHANLTITLGRCMNIPARCGTAHLGHLGDVGTPPPWWPMDFAGWFEACLGERWWTFDAHIHTPRIGRAPIARGRDACDVALASTFGPNIPTPFKVWPDEVMMA